MMRGGGEEGRNRKWAKGVTFSKERDAQRVQEEKEVMQILQETR